MSNPGTTGDYAPVDLLRFAAGAPGPIRLESFSPDGSVTTHEVTTPFAVVGRAHECDIRATDPMMSYRHLYLQPIGNRLACLDLYSNAGVEWRREPPFIGWLTHQHRFKVGDLEWRLVDDCWTGAGELKPPLDFRPRDEQAAEYGHLAAVDLELLNSNSKGLRWPINRIVTLVGRDERCRMKVADERVSRVHCSLLLLPTGLWVIDLLGKGGILLNGAAVRCGLMTPGSTLAIGPYLLTAHYTPREPDASEPVPGHVVPVEVKTTQQAQAPVEQASVEQTSVEQVPVEQVPVEQVPVEQVPVAQVPVAQVPVAQVPGIDVSPENGPTEQVSVENTPTEQVALLSDAQTQDWNSSPQPVEQPVPTPAAETPQRSRVLNSEDFVLHQQHLPSQSHVIQEGSAPPQERIFEERSSDHSRIVSDQQHYPYPDLFAHQVVFPQDGLTAHWPYDPLQNYLAGTKAPGEIAASAAGGLTQQPAEPVAGEAGAAWSLSEQRGEQEFVTRQNRLFLVEGIADTMIVRPSGNGNGFIYQDVHREASRVGDVITSRKYSHLIVDLLYAESLGKLVLDALAIMCRNTQGKVVYCNATPQTYDELERAGHARIWHHYLSLDDAYLAVHAFAEPVP